MKRFTDTAIWEKPWYFSLTAAEKLAWSYLTDRCDAVGVWTPNYQLANVMIGEAVDWEGLPAKCNGNIEILPNGKWWLVDFCRYQYGELTETCRPHRKYIEMLKHYGLYERVSEGYRENAKGYLGRVQEKEKEKEEEVELEKEEEQDKRDRRVKRAGDTSLFVSVRDAFLSKIPKTSYNHAREGPHIKKLIGKAESEFPDNPKEFLKMVLGAAYEMKQTQTFPFDNGQPFLPSIVNSSGIWPRILEYVREHGDGADIGDVPFGT